MPGDPGSDLSLVLRAIQSLDTLFEDSHRDEDRFLADRENFAQFLASGIEFGLGLFPLITDRSKLSLDFLGCGPVFFNGVAQRLRFC